MNLDSCSVVETTPGVSVEARGGTHLIESFAIGEDDHFMLRRTANCMVIALIAAIFGFTGILHWTAVIAQSVFFICLGVGILSLLFSLFEEPTETRELAIKPQIQVDR